jgi:ADP-ribose pyrophosphatase YjhB (NUDIX family)
MKRVTSAGGIVLNKEGKILLVNQKHLSWGFPKGHVEKGETNLEAAKREIYEESGVSELEYIKDFGKYERHKISSDGGDDLSQLKTIFMFLFRTKQQELGPIDPCNPEAKWIDKDNVTSVLTHRKDKEFFISVKDKLD